MKSTLEKIPRGKIITLDGTDGCGKSTQYNLLKERLEKESDNFIFQKFPNYGQASCFLVEEYLGGNLGDKTSQIPVKISSAFFSYDRALTFVNKGLVGQVESGKNLILDRYTTSNIVHQAARESSIEKIRETAKWIMDFEYDGLNLPRPDGTIFFAIDDETAENNMKKRDQNDGILHDILERDLDYQNMIRHNSILLAKEFNWEIIYVSKNGQMRPINEIHEEVNERVKKLLLK